MTNFGAQFPPEWASCDDDDKAGVQCQETQYLMIYYTVYIVGYYSQGNHFFCN